MADVFEKLGVDYFNGKEDDFLLGRMEDGGQELSGGQWQLVGLARAYFKDSEYMILDEPSAALDPISEDRIFEHLYHLSEGKSSVTISHRLSNTTLADKILVCAALLALVELKVLPSWPVLIILAREFIVSGIRMVAADKGVVIAASWYGKAKTVTQIIAIVLFIVKDSILPVNSANPIDNPLYVLSWVVMLAALALTIISMMDYFVKARHLLGFSSDKSDGGAASAPASDSNEDIARRVIERASSANKTIACAESLTGGLIAGTLTAIPGSSQVVRGGIVSYVNDVKRKELGVDESLLEREGAVCEEVARQMAAGARQGIGTDIAVAVTGIAGPGGEEPGKPVGTVWAACATKSGCESTCFHFEGDRQEVRHATVREALRMIEAALS